MTPEEKEEVREIVVQCLQNTFDVYREVHQLEETLIRSTVEQELLSGTAMTSAVRQIARMYVQDAINAVYGDSYFMQQKVVNELRNKLPY